MSKEVISISKLITQTRCWDYRPRCFSTVSTLKPLKDAQCKTQFSVRDLIKVNKETNRQDLDKFTVIRSPHETKQIIYEVNGNDRN